jgi:hypothetical protein
MNSEPGWIGALRARYTETDAVAFDDLLRDLPLGRVLSTPVGTWIRDPADTLTVGEIADPSTWWSLDAIDVSTFRAEIKYVFSADGVHMAVCDEILRAIESNPDSITAHLEPEAGIGLDKVVRNHRALSVAQSSALTRVDVQDLESHVHREAER